MRLNKLKLTGLPVEDRKMIKFILRMIEMGDDSIFATLPQFHLEQLEYIAAKDKEGKEGKVPSKLEYICPKANQPLILSRVDIAGQFKEDYIPALNPPEPLNDLFTIVNRYMVTYVPENFPAKADSFVKAGHAYSMVALSSPQVNEETGLPYREFTTRFGSDNCPNDVYPRTSGCLSLKAGGISHETFTIFGKLDYWPAFWKQRQWRRNFKSTFFNKEVDYSFIYPSYEHEEWRLQRTSVYL